MAYEEDSSRREVILISLLNLKSAVNVGEIEYCAMQSRLFWNLISRMREK